MANIIDYVQYRLATFEEEVFCEVDSIIFAWLSYLVLPEEAALASQRDGVRIGDMYRLEYFPTLFSLTQMPEETEWLLSLLAASPRFRDVRVLYYEDQLDVKRNKQFAAMTFVLPKKEIYVAFRGTDSRFTGWKEDMELTLDKPVLAQLEAHRYLEKVGYHFPDAKIIVGGHSKGGNLAVFAASRCVRHIQDRIQVIYSLDGPGFPSSSLIHEGIRLIYTRCRKLVPQTSLVGLMMDDDVQFDVIRSNKKGFMQHLPFTWEIEGDRVVRMDKLDTEAKIIERGLDEWIGGMSIADRRRFIDSVFGILEETGAGDFDTLGNNIKEYLPIILKKLDGMEKEERRFLIRMLRRLAHSEVKSIPSILKELGKDADVELRMKIR